MVIFRHSVGFLKLFKLQHSTETHRKLESKFDNFRTIGSLVESVTFELHKIAIDMMQCSIQSARWRLKRKWKLPRDSPIPSASACVGARHWLWPEEADLNFGALAPSDRRSSSFSQLFSLLASECCCSSWLI